MQAMYLAGPIKSDWSRSNQIKSKSPQRDEVLPGPGPLSLKLSLGGLGGGWGGPAPGGRSKPPPATRIGPAPIGPLFLPGGRGPPMGPKLPPNMGGPWEGGIMAKGGAMPIIEPCPIGFMFIGPGGLRWPLAGPEGGRLGGSGGGLLCGLAATHIPLHQSCNLYVCAATCIIVPKICSVSGTEPPSA